MRPLFLALLGAALAGLMTGSTASFAAGSSEPVWQRGSEAPVLRPEVVTSSDIVTVGDFYLNAGAAGFEPLFRSPDLGTSGRVSAALVAERARAAGLKSAGTDGLAEVTVRRDSISFDAQRLSGMIAERLARQEGQISADDLEIVFARTPQIIHADPRSADPLRIEQALWSRADGRFDIVMSYAGEHGYRRVSLTGVAREMTAIVALANPLDKGGIVREQDLITMRLPRERVQGRAVTDPQEILGLAARIQQRPGRQLSKADFERPMLIQRGDKVTLIYEISGMKLTTQGQAATAGADGDMIDVVNLQSRRTVRGTVSARGEVRLGSAPRTLAANTSLPAQESAQ